MGSWARRAGHDPDGVAKEASRGGDDGCHHARIDEDKGLVDRADGPRGYLWSPTVSRQTARAGLLGKLLDLVFERSARGLVARMVEEGGLSHEDRDAIRKLLDAPQRAQRPGEKEPRE
ncbi:MAG: BlaI/MecI/CopY family transcriptional regulator [Isosphaeraceae bacterium]